jgi:hypothetical protein
MKALLMGGTGFIALERMARTPPAWDARVDVRSKGP